MKAERGRDRRCTMEEVWTGSLTERGRAADSGEPLLEALMISFGGERPSEKLVHVIECKARADHLREVR